MLTALRNPLCNSLSTDRHRLLLRHGAQGRRLRCARLRRIDPSSSRVYATRAMPLCVLDTSLAHAQPFLAMYCWPGVDTYDGVLNIAGIQYSSVMFIG